MTTVFTSARLAACLLFIAAALVSPACSSHFMGATMSYEQIGGCSYRGYHTTYYDCSGAAMTGYIPISIANPYPGLTATITDLTGRLAWTGPLAATLHKSAFAPGLYIATVRGNGFVVATKMRVE